MRKDEKIEDVMERRRVRLMWRMFYSNFDRGGVALDRGRRLFGARWLPESASLEELEAIGGRSDE